MAKLIILGTSHAVPTQDHENTHMLVVGTDRSVLIDCPSNPVLHFPRLGVDVLKLTDVILTHFHPDHVSGLPLLLLSSWLMGRQSSLNIYGLSDVLDRFEKMMLLFDWDQWPNFFPVKLISIPPDEMTPVLASPEFLVSASPVHHMIPNIGLRLDFLAKSQSLAYSGDTEPCQEVVRLAKGVDVLIHESTGASFGHSSAAQAGEIANLAGAKSLFLIHYDLSVNEPSELIDMACSTFGGQIQLAQDSMELEF